MIDIAKEKTFPLKEARTYIPGRPDLSTLYRWAFDKPGNKRLEVVKVGGRWFTSREAIARFVQKCTNPAAVPPPGTNAARQRDVEKQLDSVGI